MYKFPKAPAVSILRTYPRAVAVLRGLTRKARNTLRPHEAALRGEAARRPRARYTALRSSNSLNTRPNDSACYRDISDDLLCTPAAGCIGAPSRRENSLCGVRF